MRTLLLPLILLQFLPPGDTGADILRKMYDRYHSKWFKTLTFVQKTERYQNDSLKSTATWHEAIMFPDQFRIDIGPAANGDAIIFRNDSVYRFRKGTLSRSARQFEDLTFLLGGMYFRPFDSVLAIMATLHYDLGKFHEDMWQGRTVYVIGSDGKDGKVNQLWIDKERLIVLRLLKFENGGKEEAVFENHIQLDQGWSETTCTFYADNHLIQKEYYSECKANTTLDPRLFDPGAFGKIIWFKDK